MSLPGSPGSLPPDDPLVAAAVRAAGAVSPGTCPDAEVLGLYAERALQEAERVAVDTHVSGCGRCQAIVAAQMRALPVEPDVATGAVPIGAGWLSGWRWLVPLATAASIGVVALWLGRGSSSEVAERAAGAPTFDAPVATIPPPPSPDGAPPATSAALASDLRRQDNVTARVGGPAPKIASQTPAASSKALADAIPSREERQAKAEPEAMPSAAGAAAAPAPFEALAEVASPPVSSPPAAAAVEPPSAVAVGDATGSSAERSRRAGRAEASAFRPAAGAVRWRVRDGRVERSNDGGTSWIRVDLATNEAMTSVVVRENGTVEATSSSGRVWTSNDGGASWRPPSPR